MISPPKVAEPPALDALGKSMQALLNRGAIFNNRLFTELPKYLPAGVLKAMRAVSDNSWPRSRRRSTTGSSRPSGTH